jgi:hypothetical protein
MKSKKVIKLMNWLNKKTRIIDIPRDYSEDELIKLIEIAEQELEKSPVLEQKIQEFKSLFI